MRKNRLLKLIVFLLAIVPFGGVSCQDKNNTSLSYPGHASPKYLLAGALDSIDGDFVYYSINNGTEYAVGLTESAKNNTGTKTIPNEYNEKPVTGIWRSGFYKSNYSTVNIPSSITVIDYEAFLGSKITSVTIPATVNAIGEGAFYSCRNITKAIFNNSTTTSESSSACSCSEVIDNSNEQRTYSTLTTIPSFCFFNCVSLKELILPQSIEEIEYEAFNGCSALFSTLAFMNIKTIRSRAFQNCSALTKVYISNTFFEKDSNDVPIGIIEDHAFNNCSSNLVFYLVGNSDDIDDWLELPRNVNWNWRNELSNPASSRFTYYPVPGGASYSNDWIYTIDEHGDVEISSYIGPTEKDGAPVKFISIPDELPSGSGNKVRYISLTALDSVKASLIRLYLPRTLRKINNEMFGSGFSNLVVIDDNTHCTLDEGIENPTPRIILNGITDLKVIANKAFSKLPHLVNITKLYLPYSLEAIGNYAFGSSGQDTKKHMQSVTDFRWDYDDEKSALKVIGKEAFYMLGSSSTNTSFTNVVHQGHIGVQNNEEVENYKLSTIVIPRTFEHFGITSSDQTAYGLSSSETSDVNTFAGSPLLSKVIFKGSKSDALQSVASNSNYVDDNVSHLYLGSHTFAMNESLRTVVFEERVGKSIVFYTDGGQWEPCIGLSSGRSKNDFGGDPALQTLVLPTKYTMVRVQNYAFQGNSRGVIYVTGSGETTNFKGSNETNYTNLLSNPASGSNIGITSTTVKEWRTIGDEGFYGGKCPGYCFATKNSDSTTINQNSYGLNQRMPIYTGVLYKETINIPGINVNVEVGTGNTREYVEKDKCAFVCGIATGKATMTKYLYDRYDSTFTGTAIVPASVDDSSGASYAVDVIGASAFSAAYCDTSNYANDTLHKDLTAVLVPKTITTIGEYAFMRAYGVTNFYSYDTSNNTPYADYVMPSSLTSIGKQAFAFCNIVKFLKIPNSCTFYENSVAANNTSVPGDTTSVFSNNFSLRKITFVNNSLESTESSKYETTTYTHSGTSEIYTSAIYSKSGSFKNASSLLLVLFRDAGDYLSESADLDDVTVTSGNSTTHYAEFDGQYHDYFIFGAFKMCYWIDSLIIGSCTGPVASFNQPLISGIYDFDKRKDSLVYLNTPISNFVGYDCQLKTISFGQAGVLSVPPYSFEGCEQLTKIRLPYDDDGVVPAGLFSFIDETNMVFEVPDGNGGYEECPAGVLNLTNTGYSKIGSEAFKNTRITKVIAPINDNFTIDDDAFVGCSLLKEVDFSNVTNKVTLNGCFAGLTINDDGLNNDGVKFTWSQTAEVEFGNKTFMNCVFNENTFTLPSKTSKIGTSCFEGCSSLQAVSSQSNLTELTEIGNLAFYKCTILNDFDFSKFTAITRIGHFAFSMFERENDNTITLSDSDSKMLTNNACICPNGNLVLPSTITSIGVGAFMGSKITTVRIQSSAVYFERNNVDNVITETSGSGKNKSGSQFRHCKVLTQVFFTDSNCQWQPTSYTAKTGQDNFFSNNPSLTTVVLPTGFDLTYDSNTSMVYLNDANDNKTNIYTWITLKYKTDHSIEPTWKWRKMSGNDSSPNLADIYYYAGNSLDLLQGSAGSYSYISSTAIFWTVYNNEVVCLGSPTSLNTQDGTVTFSSGGYTYTFTTSGFSRT